MRHKKEFENLKKSFNKGNLEVLLSHAIVSLQNLIAFYL